MTKSSPQKDIVMSFLKHVVSGKIREAFDAYVHPEFRHHNAYHNGMF